VPAEPYRARVRVRVRVGVRVRVKVRVRGRVRVRVRVTCRAVQLGYYLLLTTYYLLLTTYYLLLTCRAVQLGYFGIGQPNLEAEIEDAVTVPVTRVPISDGGGALLVFAWPGLELGLG